MSEYHEAIQYVISQATQAQDDKEYPSTYDISDIIHEELDYYCSTLYNGECDEIIVSYGLTKALVEYDNHFGKCPKTSQGLLYVIMMDVVREGVEKSIEQAMGRVIGNEIFKTIVTMAYEMDYADKRDADVTKVKELLEDYMPRVRTTLKTGNLRNINMSRPGMDYYTEPITFKGRPLRFAIFMEYKRYIDGGKVREEGVITVSPQRYHSNSRMFCCVRHFSRRTYRSIADFTSKLPELIHDSLSSY